MELERLTYLRREFFLNKFRCKNIKILFDSYVCKNINQEKIDELLDRYFYLINTITGFYEPVYYRIYQHTLLEYSRFFSYHWEWIKDRKIINGKLFKEFLFFCLYANRFIVFNLGIKYNPDDKFILNQYIPDDNMSYDFKNRHENDYSDIVNSIKSHSLILANNLSSYKNFFGMKYNNYFCLNNYYTKSLSKDQLKIYNLIKFKNMGVNNLLL